MRFIFAVHVNKKNPKKRLTVREMENILYMHIRPEMVDRAWKQNGKKKKEERETDHGQEPYFNSYDVIKNLFARGKVSLFLSILE